MRIYGRQSKTHEIMVLYNGESVFRLATAGRGLGGYEFDVEGVQDLLLTCVRTGKPNDVLLTDGVVFQT